MHDDTPTGILNRPLVMFAIMFTVPAFLVLVGFVYVVQSGAPPGGESRSCERFISDDVGFRIDIYQFSAGLTRYEDQSFSISRDDGDTWERVFTGRVQNPRGITCDDNIRVLAEDAYLMWHRKNIALSQDGGVNWQVQNICDEPRPEGRCDTDALDMRSVDVRSADDVVVTVEETVVDEYGIPQTEDGKPLLLNSYQLRTTDGGQMWQLESNPEE